MPRLHLLVVDPDTERRQAAADALRAAGHQVLMAGDGALAAAALAPEPGNATPAFDGLLLALALPGLDQARLREALAPGAPALPDSLEAGERRQIVLALAHTHGNRRHAAHLLGVARSTLLSKLRRYGLT